MDQPLHDLRPFKPGQAPAHRFLSIGFVALLHVVAIWALATGLIQDLASKLPQEFKAEVIPPKEQVKPPPPPPPPDLQKPPPPFVPPPEINIQTEAAPNTITTQSKVASLPPPPKVVAAPPKPAGISAPVALKAAHECNSRYYPPIAQRLNQHGTTLLHLTISADGQVTDAKVATSSGYDSLDQAAIKCVTSGSWGAYKPAMQNGQPIASTYPVAIVWQQQ
jgi:protein TonB